jgi:chorismate-pyruvate lyase
MPATLSAVQLNSYLAPLTRLYAKSGHAAPEVVFLDGEMLPEPYRHLLVHHSDMTPRLRSFHDSEMILEVQLCVLDEPELSREVLLRRRDDNQAVEFGAIKIHLDRLPAAVAQLVREGQRPLGGILEAEQLRHQSAPRAYFQTKADTVTSVMFRTTLGQPLFGRCNVLARENGAVFAEIVEILPPADDSKKIVEA